MTVEPFQLRLDAIRARTFPFRAGRVRALLAVLAVVPVLATALLVAGGTGQGDLTAEQIQLLRRVRDNVGRDGDLLRKFTYTLERRSYAVNFVGKVSNGDVHTYEVGLSPFEPGRTWRRLVAVNGVPLSPDRLRRAEEKARQDAAARRREREEETPAARALRARKEQDAEQKERERLEDIERAFRFSADGEETIAGVRAQAYVMTPRPDAQTRSDIGKYLARLRGRLLVEPEQAQLVRAEFETTGDLTLGWGVIGRVGGGSRMLYRRERATDGAWLPAEARFQGSGRTLMLIPFNIETWAKYADFRPAAPTAAHTSADGPPR
jgi:hypothetical protein